MHLDPNNKPKVRDVSLLRGALQDFEHAMQRTMLAMKEVRDAFEEVSRSSNALSSMTFCSASDRAMMGHVSKGLREFSDGDFFFQYSKEVHHEIMNPLRELRVPLKLAKQHGRACDATRKRYEAMRTVVSKKEMNYIRRQKSLDQSKTYADHVTNRENFLKKYETHQRDFSNSFEEVLKKFSDVTEKFVHRYIFLNASYLTSLLNALGRATSRVECHVPQTCAHTEALPCTPSMAEGLKLSLFPASGISLSPGSRGNCMGGSLSVASAALPQRSGNPVFVTPSQELSPQRCSDASLGEGLSPPVGMECGIGDRLPYVPSPFLQPPVYYDCVKPDSTSGNMLGTRPSVYDMDCAREVHAATSIPFNH